MRRLLILILFLAAPARSEVLLEFEGTIHAQRFLEVRDIGKGHHAIVWRGGGASRKALIETDLSDLEAAKRLSEKGLVGGNNLPEEAWCKRNDPNHPAADARVEGPTIEITVMWAGLESPQRLQDLLGLPDADYRFGDHRSLIPVWKSGCIVCNVSCPGGKISNRSLTIRDQVQQRLSPRLDPSNLPPDGTPVRVFVTR